MKGPGCENEGCGSLNRGGRLSDSWALMQRFIIYSILADTWLALNTIGGLSGSARSQNGEEPLLENRWQISNIW